MKIISKKQLAEELQIFTVTRTKSLAICVTEANIFNAYYNIISAYQVFSQSKISAEFCKKGSIR